MSFTFDDKDYTYILDTDNGRVSASNIVRSMTCNDVAAGINKVCCAQKVTQFMMAGVEEVIAACADIAALEEVLLNTKVHLSQHFIFSLRILGIDLHTRMEGPVDQMLCHKVYRTSDFSLPELACLRGKAPIDFSRFLCDDVTTSGASSSSSRKRNREHVSPSPSRFSDRAPMNSDDDDGSARTAPRVRLAIDDKRPLIMTMFEPDQVVSLGGADELAREWSSFLGSQHAFFMIKAQQYSEWINVVASAQIVTFQRDAAKAQADEARAKADSATMTKTNADDESKAAAVLTNRKLLAEAEGAERKAHAEAEGAERKAQAEAEGAERKAQAEADGAERKARAEAEVAELKVKIDSDAAKAEQRRLDTKSAAEVARDDREAVHRHLLEDSAASLAASNAASITIIPTQHPSGESSSTLELVTLFSKHTSTTEHAGLLVAKCTARGCHAWCSGLAPHFGADELPVCGFHDVNKDTYRAPGGMTKTRRVLWIMYNGVAASGICWLCRMVVLFPNFEASHIKPKCAVKDDSVNNLRPCCIVCNKNCGTENLHTFAAKQDLLAARSTDSRAATNTVMATEAEAAALLKRFTTKVASRAQYCFVPKLQSQLKTAEAEFAAHAAEVPAPRHSSSSSSTQSRAKPYPVFEARATRN